MASLEALGATAYPAEGSAAVLVLAHGAGAGQKHPFMVATAKGLASRRISVVTFPPSAPLPATFSATDRPHRERSRQYGISYRILSSGCLEYDLDVERTRTS